VRLAGVGMNSLIAQRVSRGTHSEKPTLMMIRSIVQRANFAAAAKTAAVAATNTAAASSSPSGGSIMDRMRVSDRDVRACELQSNNPLRMLIDERVAFTDMVSKLYSASCCLLVLLGFSFL
jgi:hypothetical protein